jgi:hypothetical protein
MDMLDYLKSINNIDKELIVPSSKNFLIGKIGNDEILLKDIFKAFDCHYNTSEPLKDRICINISTLRIDDGKWNRVKSIDPSFVESLIKDLFEDVWKDYISQNGKYDKTYLFKHWVLISLTCAFWKEGWNVRCWYNKIMSDSFNLPI